MPRKHFQEQDAERELLRSQWLQELAQQAEEQRARKAVGEAANAGFPPRKGRRSRQASAEGYISGKITEPPQPLPLLQPQQQIVQQKQTLPPIQESFNYGNETRFIETIIPSSSIIRSAQIDHVIHKYEEPPPQQQQPITTQPQLITTQTRQRREAKQQENQEEDNDFFFRARTQGKRLGGGGGDPIRSGSGRIITTRKVSTNNTDREHYESVLKSEVVPHVNVAKDESRKLNDSVNTTSVTESAMFTKPPVIISSSLLTESMNSSMNSSFNKKKSVIKSLDMDETEEMVKKRQNLEWKIFLERQIEEKRQKQEAEKRKIKEEEEKLLKRDVVVAVQQRSRQASSMSAAGGEKRERSGSKVKSPINMFLEDAASQKKKKEEVKRKELIALDEESEVKKERHVEIEKSEPSTPVVSKIPRRSLKGSTLKVDNADEGEKVAKKQVAPVKKEPIIKKEPFALGGAKKKQPPPVDQKQVAKPIIEKQKPQQQQQQRNRKITSSPPVPTVSTRIKKTHNEWDSIIPNNDEFATMANPKGPAAKKPVGVTKRSTPVPSPTHHQPAQQRFVSTSPPVPAVRSRARGPSSQQQQQQQSYSTSTSPIPTTTTLRKNKSPHHVIGLSPQTTPHMKDVALQELLMFGQFLEDQKQKYFDDALFT